MIVLLGLHWHAIQTNEKKNAEVLGDQSSSQGNADIWAELKELREVAIEHKVELKNSQSKIEKLEQESTGIGAPSTCVTFLSYKNNLTPLLINSTHLR